VLPHAILPDVEAKKVHAGLIPFQGVTNTRFGCIQRQSDFSQPRHQELLAAF
jgi:hypothetical protein